VITSVPPPASARPVATTSPSDGTRESEPVEHRASALYLRLGFGFGVAFGSDVSDEYGDDEGELDFSGFGTAMDWMGGAAVLPQLVIGLGATTDTLVSGTISGEEIEDRQLQRSLSFIVIGAFADYYLAPPAGFHLQALLGLSHLSRADDLSKHTGNGFGAVLGIGYDFVVGRRFNLGILARMPVSSFSMDEVGDAEPEPTLYQPTLLWTATFRPEG
jgi:hypothetical protein